MGYSVNPAAFSAVFVVPCTAVDEKLRLASELQLKVLLCAMRGLNEGIDSAKIASQLSAPESEVQDALLFWVKSGILCNENTAIAQEEKPVAVLKQQMPTRADVARRGFEDPKIRFLMQEAQLRFGRNLNSSESSALLWLHDDRGMEISVILMLLQYAKDQEKMNITFIKKTAEIWLKNGVETVADAEKQIAEAVRLNSAWHVIESVFGIEHRPPSNKEAEYCKLWLTEWKLSKEMLKAAYDVCIDAKSKLVMPYIAKTLENWHKDGFKTPEEALNTKPKKANQDSSYAGYDLAAFEAMLDSNDD